MFFLFYRLILSPTTILAAGTNDSDSIIKTAINYFAPNLGQLDTLHDSLSQVIFAVIGITKTISDLAIIVINESTTISLSHEKIGTGWSYSIFFVNIIAIFILLAIALANTLRINLETYAIKKTLPSLIIGFIFANLSLLFSRALLDFSDLLIKEINSLFVTGDTSIIQTIVTRTTGIDISPDKTDVLKSIIEMFASQGGTSSHARDLGLILETLNKLGGGAEMQQMILIIELLIIALFLILPTLVIVALAFVAIARQIILFVLIILAPIAIILLSFPPTKSIGQKWLGQYLSWIFIIPLILFILGIATIFLPDKPDAIKEILTNTSSINSSPEGNFVSAIIGYISGIFVLLTALMIPLSLSGSSGSMVSNMMMYGAMSQGSNLIGGLFGRNKGANTNTSNVNLGGQGIGGNTNVSKVGGQGKNIITNRGKSPSFSSQSLMQATQPDQKQPQKPSLIDSLSQATLASASAFEQSKAKSGSSSPAEAYETKIQSSILALRNRIKADQATFFNPTPTARGAQTDSFASYPSSAIMGAAIGSLAASSMTTSDAVVGPYGQALLKSNTFTPEQIKTLQSTPPDKIDEVLKNSPTFNANLNNTIDVSQKNLGQYVDQKQVSANNTMTIDQLAKSYNEKFNDAAKTQATSIAKETKLSTAQIKQVNNYMSQNNIQAALKEASGDQRITNLINTVSKNPDNITYVNNTLDKLIQTKETQTITASTHSASTSAQSISQNVTNISNITNQTNQSQANPVPPPITQVNMSDLLKATISKHDTNHNIEVTDL